MLLINILVDRYGSPGIQLTREEPLTGWYFRNYLQFWEKKIFQWQQQCQKYFQLQTTSRSNRSRDDTEFSCQVSVTQHISSEGWRLWNSSRSIHTQAGLLYKHQVSKMKKWILLYIEGIDTRMIVLFWPSFFSILLEKWKHSNIKY